MKKFVANHLVLNEAPVAHNAPITLNIQKNSFNDDGQGTITFKTPVVITDGTEQWNGTKYDIASMDISEFRNKLTVNHSQEVEGVIGLVNGLKKGRGRITIEGIKFAIKTSAMARYVYNMMTEEGGPYLTDFSIETMGPWPDEENIYRNSKLVGLSAVAYGNNKSAKINQIALNSVKEAQADGLDTSLVENKFVCYSDTEDHAHNSTQEESAMKRKIKNSRGFNITVKFKNDDGKDETVTVKPGETVEVPATQGDAVQSQVDDASAPAAAETPAAPAPTAPAVSAVEVASIVTNAVKAATEPLMKQVNDLEQKVFDNSAQEPQFVVAKKAPNRVSSSVSGQLAQMEYQERHAEQINAFIGMKKGAMGAQSRLATLNEFHLEKLQEAKLVANSITIADMGNFVISPEMITEIQGIRSNFKPFLDKVVFKETLSIDMGWLERSGDIDMQPVEFCDDGADGNLKPISEYGATPQTSRLEELAAVTPVCNAATRFVAADILGDVAAGYRNDFDRKKAQLVIARLQQAVNATGFKTPYNRTNFTTSLTSWVDVMAKVQENVDGNGIWILNTKSKMQLIKDAISAGISGPLAELLMSGNLTPILGENYVVVPNELMPTLNTNETKTFMVNGVNVTVNQGLFYADLSVFTGRTSGGLIYDLSTEAAYEDGENVKSSFQRNEVLLRGSFFRGGAILDKSLVSGMFSAGLS